MSRPSVKTTLGMVYGLTLLVLLVVLALLQYQWTGEAGEAERQRMQGVLRETLAFLERSIDQEIGRVILAFWRSPQDSGKSAWTQWQDRYGRSLAEDYGRWHAAARHPRLVRQILMAENSGAGGPRLFRLLLSQGDWEESAWPEELAEFRELLVRHAKKDLSEEDIKRWTSPAGRFLFPLVPLAALPAFVFPVAAEPAVIEAGGEGRILNARAQVRLCLIIWLDRVYLTQEWLPGLAAQYLSADGSLEYDYLVRTRRKPEQVICKSPNADPDTMGASPDAAIAMLQLHLEEVALRTPQPESALHERFVMAPGGRGGVAPSREQGPVEPRQQTARIRSALRLSEDLPQRSPVETAQRRSQERRMQPVDQFRGLMEAVAADGWQLVVKHRAGSVEAAVERVRLRNLYVSFGILLVLATSIFFLAISVRRARQLARQQLEFVASISHELRTPVTAICSLSENLADGLIQPEEQVRRYGRYILREGRRLGSLVEQALEFAGLSSGRLRCRLRPIDVEPTLREALQSCEAQLQERNAQVDVQIEPGLPKIAGDAESLGCAVQNLIGNAIKYSREAAEISIQAHQLRETREVEIVVADRGMGIDPDELKQVFEPFFRGRKALSSQIRGAGIGLSLVKRIVDAHHGRVLVNNRPGGGTHVTLRLPVTDERSAPANPADARL